MSHRYAAAEALRINRANPYRAWNKGASSSDRSRHPEDASNRIYDGYASIGVKGPAVRYPLTTPVFAMGSCFAREIELALVKRGGNVVSTDESIDIPAFRRLKGGLQSGFLHRFTPQAMLLEFQRAFGEAPAWNADTLIFPYGSGFIDLNYWHIDDAAEIDMEATLVRRRVATELVRKAKDARIVVLTLGLTESFIHRETDQVANRVPGTFLAGHKEEFLFHNATVDECVAALEEIHALLGRHAGSAYEMVVTVSPVPLAGTFSDKDIVVANMDSKSTLRAAAAKFCNGRERVSYFPSYEMVTYSRSDLAWRPDRCHVQPDMVSHVVNAFMEAYFVRAS